MKNLFKSTLILWSLTIYAHSEIVSLYDCMDTHITGHVDEEDGPFSHPSIYICNIEETGMYDFQVSTTGDKDATASLYAEYDATNNQYSNLLKFGTDIYDSATGYTNTSFSIKLFKGNTYYLRIFKLNEGEDGYEYTFDGDFGLDVTQVEEIIVPEEIVIKDIIIDNLPMVGDINTSTTTERYTFTPSKTGTYTLYTSYTDDKLDTIGELFDDNNVSLANENNNGTYQNFIISYPLMAGETYHLNVTGNNGKTGSYSLHTLFTPETPKTALKNDFNGDGKADILWRKGVANHLWIMAEDGSHTYKNIGGKRLTYKVAGTGDFNADGIEDILWRRDDGVNHVWYMNKDGSHAYKNIGGKRTTYEVVDINDFNGDGIADILWKRPYSNAPYLGLYIWYMHRDGTHTYKKLSPVPGNAHILGTGDLNNDGNADIFYSTPSAGLYATKSAAYVVYMYTNGSYTQTQISSHEETLDVVRIRDFNNDGVVDMLLRKENQNHIWYMNEDGTHTDKNIGTKGTAYNLTDIADYNGDGITDILWRKGSSNYLWYMNEDGSHTYQIISGKRTSYSVQ